MTNVFHEPIDLFDRTCTERLGRVAMLRSVLGRAVLPLSAALRPRQSGTERHTQDLAAAIATETGRNLDWFLDQWVYNRATLLPVLELRRCEQAATVSVKQTQSTSGGASRSNAVTIDFARQGPGAESASKSRCRAHFRVPGRKPELCRFDHMAGPQELEFDKSVGELRSSYATTTTWRAAVRGQRTGKQGGAEAIAALEDAVMGDRFWMQAAAAKALGESGQLPPRRLLRCLSVRNLKAKRAVVAALGGFRGDQAVFDAIAPIARRDQSWFVEGEACKSIGKLRLEGSLEIIRRNIDRPSFRQVVRIGCIDGLVELRQEAARAHFPSGKVRGAVPARPPAVGRWRAWAVLPDRKKLWARRMRST